MKKAQVNILIIISILIVFLVALLLFIKSPENPSENNNNIPADLKPINDFLRGCLYQTSEKAIFEVSERGGTAFDLSSTEEDSLYYFYKGKSYMPSVSDIEKEISKEIERSLYLCTRSFEDFPDHDIQETIPEARTTLQNNQVVVELYLPISIKDNQQTAVLENFRTEVPIRLKTVYDVARQINQDTIDNPDAICISCNQKMAEENDLYIEMNELDEENVIFTIRDDNYKLNGKGLEFNFLQQYEK